METLRSKLKPKVKEGELDAVLHMIESHIEACKPKRYTLKTGYLWDSHDATDGFHYGCDQYERNLKMGQGND